MNKKKKQDDVCAEEEARVECNDMDSTRFEINDLRGGLSASGQQHGPTVVP